jgi:hypothetical protein
MCDGNRGNHTGHTRTARPVRLNRRSDITCAITFGETVIAQCDKQVNVEAVRIVTVLLGVLVALAGLLFTLQGFGAVSGSPMSNTTTWSILGPIIALVGIAIAFAGSRRRKS